MKTTCRGAALAAVILAAWHPLGALTEELSDRDVARALSIASSSDAQRALFHRPYAVAVADPAIESLEIVTEFRRFVLAAEEELAGGNWMLGRGGYDSTGRSLKDLLRPTAGQVTLRARLRFHPLNVLVTLPAIDILLGEPTLLAITTTRTPHVAPAADRGSRVVITAATIETSYNAPTIGDRALHARVVMEGKEVARVAVDFSQLE